ncbi:MAG: hypothetical protein K2N16_10695, partial [Muribaculaceae bacterium]|nr:hypothetical protein [Muribaculaceae bacterium]
PAPVAESGLSEVALDPEPIPEPEPSDYSDTPLTEPQEYYYEEEEKPSLPIFWIIWSAVLGAVIGLLIGFLLHDPIMGLFEPSLNKPADEVTLTEPWMEETQTEEPEQETQAPEPVEETATAATPAPEPEQTAPASDAVVYDYVTTPLSDLARKHYGNKNYWVYIYLENKDKISDPNRVPSNIKLVIPPKEKYESGSTESEKSENAKRKANEILKGIK